MNASDYLPIWDWQLEVVGPHGTAIHHVNATHWISDGDGWTKFYTSRPWLPSGSESHHSAYRTDKLLWIQQLYMPEDQELIPPSAE